MSALYDAYRRRVKRYRGDWLSAFGVKLMCYGH